MAIIVKGGGGKPEEKKTVTAGTSAIEVLPSSGKTMKKVTVNPTPSQSKTVSPNESAQTVSPDSGKLLSSVSVGAIQTEEKTVTAGTSATTVTPTSGKYIKKVTVNPTPSQSKTVTPSTSQQTVSPDSGKLLSKVIVNAMASGALSDITVSASGLITAQVGTSGYLASGTKKTKRLTTQAAKTVTPSESVQTAVSSGRYTTGAVKVAAIPSKYIDLAGVMGYTKVAVDTFSFTSRTSIRRTSIPHSLGEIPKMIYVYATSQVTVASDVEDIIGSEFKKNSSYQLSVLVNSINTNADSVRVSEKTNMNATETNVEVSGLANRYYGAGVTYQIITFA